MQRNLIAAGSVLCIVSVALLSRASMLRAADAEAAPKPSDSRERAIAAALLWLAHHQSPDGSWSLVEYTKQCKDDTCKGAAQAESQTAATGLGILPFLAAGQTHQKNGPFQKPIQTGLDWLVQHQVKDGNLAHGERCEMYAHGIATIALCEAYGLTHDDALKAPTQNAVHFIEKAQDPKTGGWRYHPGEAGDLSVLGWQANALYGAELAGLEVKATTHEGEKRFLASVAQQGADGTANGKFSYQPQTPPTPWMSAVGALTTQHLQKKASDAAILGSAAWIMEYKPSRVGLRDVYFWFYGTQVMHNLGTRDWDAWNRAAGETLVGMQQREGCAAGSWSPEKPTKERWSELGGRIMATSLSCLTLEVYYRYLPIFDDRKVAPPKAK